MSYPTSNPMSEPPGKPSKSLTKQTRNPTSNATSEPPRKPSTSVRKVTRSKQMPFYKHGVRIVGTAIDENCSAQKVSETIGNREKRVLTNEWMSSPTSKERAAAKAVDG